MKHRFNASRLWMLLFAFICLALCSCGDSSNSNNQNVPSSGSDQSGSNVSGGSTLPGNSDSSGDSSSSGEASAGSRDNTPVALVGAADGTVTYGNESVTIDASHVSDGYIMVNYTGSNPKVKFQLTGSNGVTYTYNLHGGYETFPLTSGNGSYTLGVFENIEGTSYSTLFTQSIDANITNEFGPYLYANQYVDFTADSQTVAKGAELAFTANEDLEVVQNVYNFIISTITYDYDKAKTVESGYLPDVDEILAIKTGICFDYASVMASMLRTQRIPTRLEVGYMGEEYHAWISTYISGKGWVNGIIEFDGNDWKLMDPTFASTSSSPVDFITKTDEYLTKYIY